MNTDEHGLKRIFISPAAREKSITNRHHPNSKFDTAARQLELICVYPCRSVSKNNYEK
jgi:hypothetical protein